MNVHRVLLPALLLAAGHVSAQSPAPEPGCPSAESRQFDFWLGEWDVFGPKGKQAGTNSITSVMKGCALREEWTGAAGNRGTSLNVYDPVDKQWHQTWADGSGLRLRLDGGMQGSSMVLAGTSMDAEGKRTRDRITWTPNADGTVRQLWEQSSDEGKTWTVAFDGRYVKKKPS